MTTRLHGWLRMLLAVVTFACTAVAVTADPAAAAPSVVIVASVPERAASQITQRTLAASSAFQAPRTRVSASPERHVRANAARRPAPALVRAPRLYLRHCVLLR